MLSFGLFWGISDVFRSRSYDNIVAVAGGTDITRQVLSNAVQNQIKAVNAELKGKNISFKQFAQVGGVKKVLDRVIDELLIDKFIRTTGVNTPNTVVVNLLTNLPVFAGRDGRFDREKFARILQTNNLQEAVFIGDIKRTQNRVQLLSAVGANVAAPAITALKMFEYFTTTRDISVIQNMPVSVTYNEQAVKEYFEAHKHLFKKTERRKVFLITLNPTEMAKKYTFGIQELKDAYGQNLDAYTQPEKRTVTLGVVKTLEEAKTLQEKMRRKEMLPKEVATTLQDVSERMLPPDLGPLVFAAVKGSPQNPMEMKGQYVVVYVTDIMPSQIMSFAKAQPQILADLRRQRGLDEISKVTEKIESLVNKGMNLYEVSKSLQLPGSSFSLDKEGNVLEGKAVLNADIIKDALSLAEGEETPITESADDISYLLKVEKITPEYVPDFGEVKQQATKLWTAHEKRRLEKALYEDLQNKALKGIPFNALSSNVRRVDRVTLLEGELRKYGLGGPVLKAVFAAKKGGVVLVDTGDTYALVKVDDLRKMSVEKNIGLYKMFKENVSQSISQDLSVQFLKALRYQYQVDIHEQVLNGLAD